ncbi:MAG: SRPBCC family protein [Rhodospirillaceae bacterium]|nr:SRPBCC family protein [Rhodospirillaceae bacterium]
MLKTIAIVIVVLLAVILGYAATRPDTFKVERSATMNAPPEVVFALINDFKTWTAWSAYETKDPNMKRTYGGAETGVGATYAWDGNSDIGAGSMVIAESVPATRIKIDMHFTRPMDARNDAVFVLTPDGNGTKVNWSMSGESAFMFKLMSLFFNMDKMIGADFETGLAAMKAVAEKTAAENAAAAAAATPAEGAAPASTDKPQ